MTSTFDPESDNIGSRSVFAEERVLILTPVVLLGPPGAGKTVVGATVAERLGLPFIDVDAHIEEQEGKTVRELFAEQGEAGFRALEAVALSRLLHRTGPAIIALGAGGTTTLAVQKLLSSVATVLLDVEPRVAVARLKADAHQRPLLDGAGPLIDIYEALERPRASERHDLADATFDTSRRTVGEVSNLVSGYLTEATFVLPPRAYSLDPRYSFLPRRDLRAKLGESQGPVFVDANVRRAHPGLCGQKAIPIEVGPEKTMAQVMEIADIVLAHSKDAPTVAVGGGALLDMVGFACALARRGTPWVAVPTTLLAMCDAAIGGKTASDHALGKNLLGAFHPPEGVWMCLEVLETLPARQLRAGAVEAFKHTLLDPRTPITGEGLGDDPALSALLAGQLPGGGLRTLVSRSVRFKSAVVACDPTDLGVRRALNLGHTLGHAIEKAMRYRNILHGEAVALGLRFALDQSVRRCGLPRSFCDRACAVLDRLDLPSIKPALSADILSAVCVDKKNQTRTPRFVLLAGPGRVLQREIPLNEVARGLSSLLDVAKSPTARMTRGDDFR